MLLTLTSTRVPATDLGYLLHKHPGRVHETQLAAVVERLQRRESRVEPEDAAGGQREPGRDPDVRPQLRVVRIADRRHDRQPVPTAVHREHDENVAGLLNQAVAHAEHLQNLVPSATQNSQ